MSKSNYGKSNQRGGNNFGLNDLQKGAENSGLVVRTYKGNSRPYKAVSKASTKSPNDWQADGVDHIVIAWNGTTELGKMLDFGYRFSFKHNIFDSFDTLQGFMAWVRSVNPDDNLRYKTGRELREIMENATNRRVPNLKAIMMDTAYQRIRSSPRLHKLFYENELPFDMYSYGESGLAVRGRNYDWVVGGYEEIKDAIHEGREPDFKFLCDDGNPDIYHGIRPVFTEEQLRKRAEIRRGVMKTPHTPVAKPAGPRNQKPGNFKVDAEEGYSKVIPILSDATELLLINEFSRDVTVGDVTVTTAPVRSCLNIPMLEISDHQKFIEMGVQSHNDVIRPGPIMDETFSSDFKTNNVLRLDGVVFTPFNLETFGPQDPQFSLNLGLRLMNLNIDNDTDQQNVVMADGVTTLNRTIVIVKSLNYLHATNQESGLAYLSKVKNLVSNLEDAAKYTYGIFLLRFKVVMDMNGSPSIFFEGNVNLIGITDGDYYEKNRNDRFVSEYQEFDSGVTKEILLKLGDAEKNGHITGYNFTMFRGKLVTKGEPVVEVKADPAEAIAVESVVGETEMAYNEGNAA